MTRDADKPGETGTSSASYSRDSGRRARPNGENSEAGTLFERGMVPGEIPGQRPIATRHETPRSITRIVEGAYEPRTEANL